MKQQGPCLHQILNLLNMRMRLRVIRYEHSRQRGILEILCHIIIPGAPSIALMRTYQTVQQSLDVFPYQFTCHEYHEC